jgi:hypothetical protein
MKIEIKADSIFVGNHLTQKSIQNEFEKFVWDKTYKLVFKIIREFLVF